VINYRHLHYFWAVAKAGSISRASERLSLTPQTISGQLGRLEEHLGRELFLRSGRNLQLTEAGRLVLGYAEEIFSLGGELEEALRRLPPGRPLVFKVGVMDMVPKSIAYRLLAPALQAAEPVHIVCREGSLENLLADLAVHRIDLVLADRPIPPTLKVAGFNHALGECGVTFFATPELAQQYGRRFPRGLDDAPLLLPGETAAVRSRLMRWFDAQNIHPRIAGEFEDSALMKAFGSAGAGVFVAPSAIRAEVERQYGVTAIGQSEDVREQFYALSVERRISHPAVAAITAMARAWLVRDGDARPAQKQRRRNA